MAIFRPLPPVTQAQATSATCTFFFSRSVTCKIARRSGYIHYVHMFTIYELDLPIENLTVNMISVFQQRRLRTFGAFVPTDYKQTEDMSKSILFCLLSIVVHLFPLYEPWVVTNEVTNGTAWVLRKQPVFKSHSYIGSKKLSIYDV